jgi:hypothetical protein
MRAVVCAGFGCRQLRIFHSILPTGNNGYAGVDIASITGSMEYA